MHVIIGCGSVGYNVARLLRDRGKDVLILDRDKKRVEDLRDAELSAQLGDLDDLDAQREELAEAGSVLLMSTNMKGNLNAVRWIKRELPAVYVLVRALDPVSAEEFLAAGADSVVQPSEVLARGIIRELQDLEVQRAGSVLAGIIKGAKRIAIVLHNSPDPDAMASGMALKAICRHLGTESDLLHGGKVGHQENRAFVNLLDVELTELSPKDDVGEILRGYEKVALIESSLPGKNNVVPQGIRPNLVFDHHPAEDHDVDADFAEVRTGVGATATIMTKYLQQLNVPVDAPLATALLYAIRTDTKSFTKGATAEDMAAATFLSAYADMNLLGRIETPPMSSDTLDVLARAVLNREVFGSALLSGVGYIGDRDTLPQSADYLMQLEGISTVVVYGILDDTIYLSARSNDVRLNLGEAMERVFGKQNAGGHPYMAGGQIRLGIFGDVEDEEGLVRMAREAMRKQFFKVLGIEEKEGGGGR